MKFLDERSDSSSLLAFCHIEKAAGTSLTHVLRRVFFLQYAAVRPMHSRDYYYFSARDLKTIRRCHPFLRCIGGHSVVPHGDLMRAREQLKFITQVRDPVARAASQYAFWVNRLRLGDSPEDFLKHPHSQNFQVKKIAGIEDIDLAKEKISKHFLLAGTTDRFDEFLVFLAHKLGIPLELCTYRKRNVASESRIKLPDNFLDELNERNQLDRQLYDWIDSEMHFRYLAEYSGDFSSDLEEFRRLQLLGARWTIRRWVDSMYRNGYLNPLSGLIRVANGLPYRGSYSIE